ncbi:hypothetical protein VSR68_39295 [Paraburkholderia phymatum]|uniref:hypothetical protein n=1 Tax=Paraburkholderia phymatum TaxID=148447 RepID=UPI00317E7ADC
MQRGMKSRAENVAVLKRPSPYSRDFASCDQAGAPMRVRRALPLAVGLRVDHGARSEWRGADLAELATAEKVRVNDEIARATFSASRAPCGRVYIERQ